MFQLRRSIAVITASSALLAAAGPAGAATVHHPASPGGAAKSAGKVDHRHVAGVSASPTPGSGATQQQCDSDARAINSWVVQQDKDFQNGNYSDVSNKDQQNINGLVDAAMDHGCTVSMY